VTRDTIIVTDGEQRSALAAVRSLGRAGYRCVVTSATGHSLAGASRFAARDASVPDALSEPAAFAASLTALVTRERARAVFPMTDAAILALAPVRGALGDCVLPVPPLDQFRALSDKEHLLRIAGSTGIHVPAQVSLIDARAASSLDAGALSYPVVIKPARSVGEAGGVRRKLGVEYAADANALRASIAGLPAAAYPVLLQQRIVGPGIGIFLLVWNGDVIAEFAHRRITEKPPSGGVSVYRESIPMDAALLAQSRVLLQHFSWSGVAMIEYKRDDATGRAYLMEINGRFWGSLQLAIDAGVDFPALLAGVALGKPVVPVREYRAGVRSRWWWGHVDHLIARMKSHDEWPPGTAGAARVAADAVGGVLRSGDREEIFRWSDPRPFIRESINWVLRR